MPTRDENRPFLREAGRTGWKPNRVRVGNGDRIVYVQFAPSAIVEQAERGIAALLNFCQHNASAKSVDCARRDENDITFRNWTPLNQFDDRAVRDRHPQFLLRYPALQADADLRARFRRDDIPRLALAVRHPHRARKGVVRMDLNGQWLASEQ